MPPPPLDLPATLRRVRRILLWSVVVLLLPALRAGEDDLRRFDLPANPAEETLKRYAEQSGRPLIMSAKAVQGIRTNAVHGRFTPREALERVLANTGLEVVEDRASGSLAVRQRPAGGATRQGEKQPTPGNERAPPSVKKNDRTQQPLPPMKRNRLVSALAAAAAFVTAPLDAQTAPSGRNPGNPAAGDETVELSPFVVQSSRDTGYVAANTLSGSRLNTPLRDTPASISVMTSEFLSDIGAFELNDAMKYAVNVEFFNDDDRTAINYNAVFQEYQTYRVRGLPSSRSRNYFAWRSAFIPDETAFLDRIEDSRGPNSVLFGIGSPGGIINSSTKQPRLDRSLRRTTATIGSHDSRRATFDYNQPMLSGRLAMRLNLVYNHTNTFRHFEFSEHKRALLSALYKVNNRSRVRVEFERGQLDNNTALPITVANSFLLWHYSGRPTTATQTADAALGTSRLNANNARVTYLGNTGSARDLRGSLTTTNTAVPGAFYPDGYAIGPGPIRDTRIADYSINIGGPAQNRSSRYHILSAFFNHELARNTHLELAFNHLKQKFDNRHARGGQNLFGDPNQFLGGAANPMAGDLYLETNWFRTTNLTRSNAGRIALSHELDAEKWGRYRFAGLAEYDRFGTRIIPSREVWIDPSTGLGAYNSTVPENALNYTWRRTYPVEGNWSTYAINGPVGGGGLLKGIPDPRTPGRLLDSAWVPNSGTGSVNWDQKSGMVVTQARYFSDRLVLSGGLRRDEITERVNRSVRDPVNGQYIEIDERLPASKNIGRTKTYGIVYHLHPAVSLIYNWADNVSLPARNQYTVPDSGEPGAEIPVPSPRGVGEDFGVGLTLFGGRINAKAIAYTTSSKKQSTNAAAALRVDNPQIMDALLTAGYINQAEYEKRATNNGTHGLFDQDSEGYELQITANPTRNWRLTASYARTKAVQSNTFTSILKWFDLTKKFLAQFPQNLPTDGAPSIAQQLVEMQDELDNITSSDGTGKLGNRFEKVSLFTRYTFAEGALRGLYFGGGLRYQGKMYVGLDPAGRKLWGNSYARTDLLAGYTVRGLPKGRKLSFQLNVDNVFDDQTPLITRYNTSNGGVWSEVVQSPITWKLTTDFEF